MIEAGNTSPEQGGTILSGVAQALPTIEALDPYFDSPTSGRTLRVFSGDSVAVYRHSRVTGRFHRARQAKAETETFSANKQKKAAPRLRYFTRLPIYPQLYPQNRVAKWEETGK